MKIDRIISQIRRDFIAVMICEHCRDTKEIRGYDDSYYHREVIPKMKYQKCGKTSPDNYRPLTTKYPDGVQI